LGPAWSLSTQTLSDLELSLKKSFLLCFFITSFLFSPINFAAKQNNAAHSIDNKINKILADFGENVNIGILVEDAKTGKVIYQKNDDRYFDPASVQKLLTAYVAWYYLGSDFTYNTTLYADTSKIINGILYDNVYIKFSGDPSFTFEQFDHLIKLLAQTGVAQINGNIIIDDTAFDQAPMSSGAVWDDKFFCWAAPVNTLIIDHNCAYATLLPSEHPGKAAQLIVPEQPQFVHFINNVTTGTEEEKNCRVKMIPISETAFSLNGCVKKSDQLKDVAAAINNPQENTIKFLAFLLDKYQISFSNGVVFEKITNPPAMIAQETSATLQTLITSMLKDSDNIIADALFKTVGAHYAKEQGNWLNGNIAFHEILAKKVPLTIPPTTLLDGSGLSRYNYFTPQQIVTVLRKMYSSSEQAMFISALPASGVDGTLANRMDDTDLVGKIHAKTGTETAVTALAGYMDTEKNHTLIFSIMINGFVDLPEKYKVLEDEICAALNEML
jgi:D-alanyl-D-alanine carboxypeptidase/D-alanyl-D-alanine-endopeptidase (penicillin-binding protein 4)